MKLSVAERLLIQNLLPREGDLTSVRIIMDLRRALGFTEAESKALGLRNTETGVQWNPQAAKPKEVTIGPKGMAIIVAALEDLNKRKKLTPEHLPVWERFMEPEKNGNDTEVDHDKQA